MKYLAVILLFSIAIFSLSPAQEEYFGDESYDSGCWDYDCGLTDSSYETKPETTWYDLTYDELAGLDALPPDEFAEMAYVPSGPSSGCVAFECDDKAIAQAGQTIVSTDEAEDAVAEKGAAFLAQNRKCEPCELDEAIANLTAGESDRGPASQPSCEMTDENNNCVDLSGTDSGGGAK